MLTENELIMLVRAYNNGDCSFAEILLASGKTVAEFVAFLKKYDIELDINAEFLNRGRGLSEEQLKRMLEGIS